MFVCVVDIKPIARPIYISHKRCPSIQWHTDAPQKSFFSGHKLRDGGTHCAPVVTAVVQCG